MRMTLFQNQLPHEVLTLLHQVPHASPEDQKLCSAGMGNVFVSLRPHYYQQIK